MPTPCSIWRDLKAIVSLVYWMRREFLRPVELMTDEEIDRL